MDDTELLSHLEQFGQNYTQLARLAAQFLAWRARKLFGSPQLPVLHKIEHRAKSIHSLQRNLEAKRYKKENPSIADVTDLAAARLIFFFKDDLERFVNDSDFEGWFGAGVKTNHIKGSKLRDGSRAENGYESHHIVFCVTQDTDFYRALNQSDQNQLSRLCCEVQLRTVLQHAWAEPEHDLRYKVENVSKKPCPQAESNRLLQTAKSIGVADKALANVKASLSRQFGLGKAGPADAPVTWRYTARPDGFAYREVRYEYLVIDRGPSPPSLREKADIFDLDCQMHDLLGISQYKQKMWEMLLREEPQFISQVSRDSLVTRVAGWDADERTLTIQPAYYSDEVVTNHQPVLDKNVAELEPPHKVRSLAADADGKLLDFGASPLTNTVGVACVVRVERSRWVIPRRSQTVAFDSGKLGCSSSGALEWNELGHWSGRDFVSWFAGGISRELEEELGLKIEPQRFKYLALAREFGRGGKPQLFFFLDLNEFSFRTIEARWTTYTRPPMGESHSQAEYLDLRSLNDDDAKQIMCATSDRVLFASKGIGVSEELRMNLALAFNYLEQCP